ncbi:hypothetical protein BN59_03519 [Legionella massiliensis]|uniref:Uncharacterized protein n=1 Tax=Legionella massiliensis TaxID=1034943 RepID=A0A078L1X5_9GAMM|nr:hypothetical protein BN59_03519 [Legionella massiliensis]CEE14939.1 hypothetical protein BN1094_03519 [Legionella massiliensis]
MFGMTRPLPLRGWGAPKYVRHVERRETSPECGTVLIPEIPHYVRDDEAIAPKGLGCSQIHTSCRA